MLSLPASKGFEIGSGFAGKESFHFIYVPGKRNHFVSLSTKGIIYILHRTSWRCLQIVDGLCSLLYSLTNP